MQGGGGNKERFQYFVLTRQDKKFFISEVFKVIQDATPLILHYRTMCQLRTISSSTLSCWMCNQFTLHHKFRIDTERAKFRQGKTDSILHVCESHGQGSQRSVQARLDQTTSRITQEDVGKTPGYGVLGRCTACSTKRIEVLSKKIECNHPLRYTPSLLYFESCCDGLWRNHIRESVCVTSTTTDDFLQR